MPQMTMIEAIRDALDVMMTRDDRVVVFGEDVGYFGGVFRCTEGLQRRHGKSRCFDTPISETGIIGVAVGMGAYGLRPVLRVLHDGCPSLGRIADLHHVERHADLLRNLGFQMRGGIVSPRDASVNRRVANPPFAKRGRKGGPPAFDVDRHGPVATDSRRRRGIFGGCGGDR